MNKTLLRRYSQFLYRHIHRYDYGWDTLEGRRRVPKDKLVFARAKHSNRSLQKLSEKHLERHLTTESTYYYTGSNIKRELLLCVDIDAHEGQSDAPDVAKYLNTWWFNGFGYMEPSTNGLGVHLYFRVSFPEYTATKRLHELFRDLLGMMQRQAQWEEFESTVCMIGGLPSDWSNDTMARIIKLPRPQTDDDVKALVNMPLSSLFDMRDTVLKNQQEHPCFHSEPQTPSTPSSPSVFFLHNDCHHPSGTPNESRGDVVAQVRSRNPLYRALWTVRTLSHVMGRVPSVMEGLELYERLQLGTGAVTESRIRRFQQAIEFTSRTFDPSKRRSFRKIQPVLKVMIEKAIGDRPDANLTFKPTKAKQCSVSVESLCVGYYFALWQLGKTPDGSLPIDGIMSLNQRLLEDKEVVGPISGQKASAIRRILVRLGFLEVVDENYTWGNGRGRAKRFKLAALAEPRKATNQGEAA